MLQGYEFNLKPQWKALVSVKNRTLSILLEFQAALYWQGLAKVTEGQLESTSNFLTKSLLDAQSQIYPRGGLGYHSAISHQGAGDADAT